MARTFVVRDTKTGKVIRTGTFGEGIATTKLKARARTVRRTIKPTTVSAQEARERAKQDLELIARAEQVQKAEAEAITRRAQEKERLDKLKTEEARRTLEANRLKFLTKALTAKQQQGLIKRLRREQQKDLFLIDIDKRLSPIQKEEAKRNILGILEPKDSPLSKVIKRKSVFKNAATESVVSSIKSKSLKNKAITGQSMTPSQIKKLSIELNKSPIEKQQLRAYRSGAIQFSNIAGGFLEGSKEIILLPVDLVAGGVNFGRGLVKRAVKQKTRTINVLGQDIRDFNKRLFDTGDFIRDKPKEALLILGTVASLAGGQILKDFKSNPGKSIGKLIAFYKTPKLLKKAFDKTLGAPLLEEQFSDSTFKVSKNLVTGSTTVKGTGRGILKNQNKFTSEFKLKVNPKTGDIIGDISTKVGKTTTKQKLKLIDKGAFYVDEKSGLKVNKIKAAVVGRDINIVEDIITPKRTSIVTQGTLTAKQNIGDIIRTTTQIADKNKKVTRQFGQILQAVDTKTRKQLFEILRPATTVTKKTRLKLGEQFSQRQIRLLEDFLKKIKYNQKTLEGFDKRRRVSIALGLKKDSKLLKGLEQIVDDDGKVLSFIRRKGKADLIARFQRGAYRVKKKKVGLKRDKRGNYNIFDDNKIEVQKRLKTGKIKTTNTVTLPQLTPRVALTAKGLKFYGITGLLSGILRDAKDIVEIGILKDPKKALDKARALKRAITDLRDTITEKDTRTKQPTKITQPLKTQATLKTAKPTTRLITKTKSRIIRGPRVLVPKPTLPPRGLRLPKIDWDLKKKDNRVLVFDIVYRERRNKSKNFNKKTNPVITKTISVTTTRNRALNKAAFIADNSSPRSIDIKLVGGTKLKTKDVGLSKIVKKFNRQPKTNSLKFLEDPKFTIDTSGEKRGLALARKRAPTTATKKTLKKKPTKPTKNKKSSQNRSKRSKL